MKTLEFRCGCPVEEGRKVVGGLAVEYHIQDVAGLNMPANGSGRQTVRLRLSPAGGGWCGDFPTSSCRGAMLILWIDRVRIEELHNGDQAFRDTCE